MNDKDKKKANIAKKLDDKNTDELPPQDWHPADVVAELHKSGTTMMKLAKSHGLTSANTLSKALRSSFPVAERRIAEALGLHPKEIWPSRYFPSGESRPRGYRAIQFSPSEDKVNTEESNGANQDIERRKGDRRETPRDDS